MTNPAAPPPAARPDAASTLAAEASQTYNLKVCFDDLAFRELSHGL